MAQGGDLPASTAPTPAIPTAIRGDPAASAGAAAASTSSLGDSGTTTQEDQEAEPAVRSWAGAAAVATPQGAPGADTAGGAVAAAGRGAAANGPGPTNQRPIFHQSILSL